MDCLGYSSFGILNSAVFPPVKTVASLGMWLWFQIAWIRIFSVIKCKSILPDQMHQGNSQCLSRKFLTPKQERECRYQKSIPLSWIFLGCPSSVFKSPGHEVSCWLLLELLEKCFYRLSGKDQLFSAFPAFTIKKAEMMGFQFTIWSLLKSRTPD